MGEPGDADVGSSRIRPGYQFDVSALEHWLSTHIEDYKGPTKVTQFNGGQSNPTYRLDTAERSYVLRRKPPGELLKGAHAIEREARVLTAIGQTGFPVPQVYALCADEGVIGTSFYVMELVEGRIFWDARLPGLSRTDRASFFDAMNAVIAQLHGMDYRTLGLADFGRPGDYFVRQIERWSRQYFEDVDAGRYPSMDRLIDWLRQNLPIDDDMTSITHGDFRIDNLIFHPIEPRIVAVLDWELSTLGHPGADFAYNAMMYRVPPHIVAGLGGANLASLGTPSEQDYVAAYCRRTSRSWMPHYRFYIAFSFFRLAAIFHGIKGRVVRGTASSAHASERVAALPELMDLAWAQVSESAGQKI